MSWALVRRRALRCGEVSERLSTMIDGEETDPRASAHLQTCLRCQAELARYRKLARLVRQVGSQRVEPPSELLAQVLAALERVAQEGVERSLHARRRAAYLAGLAAAAGAAGAAGAILVVTRGRARPTPAEMLARGRPGG